MGLISQCEFSISDPKHQCLGLFLKNKRQPQKIESESRYWFRAERITEWFEGCCRILLTGTHSCWKDQAVAEFIWLSIGDCISDRNT